MTKSDDKRVPALRFKGFTDEWEQRKLGDIAKTYSGGTPSVTNKNFYNNGYIPFIKSGEIGSSKTEQKINNDGLNNSSAKLVKTGTLLYALYGATSGKAAISPINGAINQAVLAIIPQTNVNRFIYEWLNKNKPRITEKYLQGGQGNLSAKIIKQINIFTTSKNEELKISDILGIVEKIISLQQRKLENYLLIKKKLSNIFFNDRIVNKNDLLFEHRVKANQIFISYSKKGFSHLPVLSASQDKGMIFRKDESKNILYTHDNLTNYKLVEPDNFVVHLRSFQAGFAYSDKTGIASPAYTIFKFKNNVAYNSVYWKEKFKSYNFIQLLKKITYGVRDGRSISFSDFLSLYLTFPDIKLQNKIGNVLSKLDTQISDQKEIIKKLENIKQFLLQNMFI